MRYRLRISTFFLLAVGILAGALPPARATSLDGAGRIVIVPYTVSGRDR